MPTLALLRHGRAEGQAPDARLTVEGEAHVRRLAARLAAEGWQPAAAFTSHYARARATAQLLLAGVAPERDADVLPVLVPDHDPARALAIVRDRLPAAGIGLFVSHLPLLGLLAQSLLDDDPGFQPGTLVEIELEAGRARLVRRIGPADVPPADPDAP